MLKGRVVRMVLDLELILNVGIFSMDGVGDFMLSGDLGRGLNFRNIFYFDVLLRDLNVFIDEKGFLYRSVLVVVFYFLLEFGMIF